MNSVKDSRRPWRNFFINRSLQFDIVCKIILTVIIAAALSTFAIATAYHIKASKGSFYYMSNDVRQDIELKGILGIILPGVIAAQAISILVGAGIGLFSSRKAAVPIYKVEKWVRQLRKGNLAAQIRFRESGPLRDLSFQCNDMAEHLRRAVKEAADMLNGIPAAEGETGRRISEARKILAQFEV